jgi:hypothetical protein
MRKKKKEEEKNAYFTLNIELYPKWILKAMWLMGVSESVIFTLRIHISHHHHPNITNIFF